MSHSVSQCLPFKQCNPEQCVEISFFPLSDESILHLFTHHLHASMKWKHPYNLGVTVWRIREKLWLTVWINDTKSWVRGHQGHQGFLNRNREWFIRLIKMITSLAKWNKKLRTAEWSQREFRPHQRPCVFWLALRLFCEEFLTSEAWKASPFYLHVTMLLC